MKNRFVTATTAMSLALATMQPLPLLAQNADGTAQDCVPTEAEPCAPAEGEGAAPGLIPESLQNLGNPPGETPAEPAPEPVPEIAPGLPVPELPAPEAPPAEQPPQEDPATPAPEEVPADPVPEVAPEVAPEPGLPVPEFPAPQDPPAEVTPQEDPATPAPEAAPEPVPEVPAPEAAPEEAAPEEVPPTEPAPSESAPAESLVPQPAPEPTPGAEPAPEASAPAEAAVEEPVVPVDAPVPTEEAVDTLTTILGGSDEQGGMAAVAAAAAAFGAGGTTAPAEGADPAAPSPEATETTVTEITAADSRASNEEFTAAPTALEGGKKSGLSNLEKVGLVALGALAVGAVLSNRDEVVENTGDRVVVRKDDGNYYVLKDDDTLLRRPGSTVRTESFADGSTRSIVEREDGSQIITIRDASGRVLRRSRLDINGSETLLIDDLTPVESIDVTDLPPPREDLRISTSDDGASLRAAMASIEARENARAYSLRQIREYREVRALAPTIDVESIRFRTGSAAIDASQAENLAELGNLIAGLIDDRPNEVFLIEGHTDAVGSAASNLSLSDRRAESVALALTEYFGVPPENLVVQGYGESDLRVPTDADEPLNRRAAVRLITPLLQQAALR